MKEFAGICPLTGLYLTPMVVILGAIIGSFLTVCIYRIPFGRPKGPPTPEELEGDQQDGAEGTDSSQADSEEEAASSLSISNPPRSFCPQCNKQLLWWHNIPIVSWLLLKGRCHFCKAAISFRYPMVEILSALCAFGALFQFGFTPTALIIFIFCAALIVISFIDIDYYIIPDVISLPSIILGMLLALFNHFYQIFDWPLAQDFWASLIGVAFGGGVLLFISEVYYRIRKRVGLGLGDVKLLAMTGAFFGFEGAFATIFYGSLLGSVIGVLLILLSKRNASQHLPFGPYLALGAAIYIFTKRVLFFP